MFIIAVQCGQAGGTCFCVSMNTGPVAEDGFDLALTEIVAEAHHYFVVEVGSPRGHEVLDDVPHRVALDHELRRRDRVHERTASQMGRELDTDGIKELLYRNYEHPRWDEVADRCLTCGNCTMVCPTCFCTTVEDVTDLDGSHVERHQLWDSCFTVDYSHIHGGARPHLLTIAVPAVDDAQAWRPGGTSSTPRAASAAVAASPGARSGSTSPRRPQAIRQTGSRYERCARLTS